MKFLSKIRLLYSIFDYGKRHNLDFAREHAESFEQMRSYLRERVGELADKRVLDVGCGKSMWLSVLLHSAGARVTGIDTEYVTTDRGLKKYRGVYRENGLDRALRTLIWDATFARSYFRELEHKCGFPLRFDLDARTMSGEGLDFPDDTFDVVVSHEVFEHIEDLPAAAKEVARTLKPDGITYIYVHNFASISGGHHIAWKYPDTEPSDSVPAWDHLRENKFPDIPSYINRKREPAYKAAFEPYFDILDWVPSHEEGRAQLTDEIRAELSDYSDTELLTKGFVIVGRPKTKEPVNADSVGDAVDPTRDTLAVQAKKG